MTKTRLSVACFVFAFALAGIALAQPQDDRPSDQPPRDEPPPRRESRRDDDPSPPPPPKQKQKELWEGFPVPKGWKRADDDGRVSDAPPREGGRPGGDKNGPPKGKAGPGDRRPGEESLYEMNIRVTAEAIIRSHDRNGDGQLDRTEWTHIQDAEKYDSDHDGVITLKELINGSHGTFPAPHFFQRGGAGGFPGPGGEMPGAPGHGGGFGGGRVFGSGPMPGMPGPFGEQPPDDPEMRDLMRQDMELDRDTHTLAMRVRESRGEERTKLKAELSQLVNKHFDIRQERRQLQLKRMDDELQRLREAISTRNKSRESIVTNHIKELTGEERDFEF